MEGRLLILIILVFYILVLLQTSFLVYFNIWGMVPNLVIISVILLNLFEKPANYLGLWSAAISGFFLDIFSEGPIGFEILILLSIAISIKLILKKYVRIPIGKGA